MARALYTVNYLQSADFFFQLSVSVLKTLLFKEKTLKYQENTMKKGTDSINAQQIYS